MPTRPLLPMGRNPFRRTRDEPVVDAVVLMSGQSSGLSGGDVHAMRLCDVLARQGSARVRLVAPASLASKLPASVHPYLVPIRIPFDGHIRSMPAYLIVVSLRTLAAARIAPAAQVAVASSHFFFDVVPAAVMRRRYGVRVAAYVYHLVGESDRGAGFVNRVSSALESFSLAVLRRAGDVIFVDNEETRRALVSRGFRPEQLAPTQNAYDPLEPLPTGNRTGVPSVVFIGRLVESKGVWDVLALARALRGNMPAARVSLIGDGPLRAELERALASDQVSNVELVGFVSEAEKWRRLRAASLFVSPSREEGWGIAVGEALIAGVPAVVYNLPAYRHFAELLVSVPSGDTEAFIRTAMELLSDTSRLEQARLRVEGRATELPRWDAVLAGELEKLGLA
jgi:glycosyltransferase involved in cell wall biosynthesis